jgi:hypothetical protein
MLRLKKKPKIFKVLRLINVKTVFSRAWKFVETNVWGKYSNFKMNARVSS